LSRSGIFAWIAARTGCRGFSAIVEAWSVTGDADATARVRTVDNADLELHRRLQLDGQVIRTRSQAIMRGPARRAAKPVR
jgi:hypothetical protein